MSYATDHISRALTPGAGVVLALLGDLGEGQSGLMVPTGPGWSPGIVNLSVASQGRFARFRPPRDFTPISAAFSLVVATIPNNETLEIWITDSAGNKLFTTGSVAGLLNAGGGTVKTASFVSPQVLKAGSTYYYALTNSYTGTTPPQIVTMSAQDVSAAALYGSALGALRFGSQASLAPGSSPATLVPAATAASSQLPLLVLREP